MSANLMSLPSCVLIPPVIMMPSNDAVELVDSSLDNHSHVGFPLNTTLPLIDPSHFSVRYANATYAFCLSC